MRNEKKTKTSNFNCSQVKVLLARTSCFKRLLCGFPVTWKSLLTLWNNPQDISTSAFLSYIWNFRNWNRFFWWQNQTICTICWPPCTQENFEVFVKINTCLSFWVFRVLLYWNETVTTILGEYWLAIGSVAFCNVARTTQSSKYKITKQ